MRWLPSQAAPPNAEEMLSESLSPRAWREFWTLAGSGQVGLALLVLAAFAGGVAVWVTTANKLHPLVDAARSVGAALGIPLLALGVVWFGVRQPTKPSPAIRGR